MEIEIQQGGKRIEPTVELSIGTFKLSSILAMGPERFKSFQDSLSDADRKAVADAYARLMGYQR